LLATGLAHQRRKRALLMRLISEALTNIKRRRTLVEKLAKHTDRQIWKDELRHIEYTIRFLRGEISLQSKPFAKEKKADVAVRSDLLLRGRRLRGSERDLDGDEV
jgi:hypothetical protein